MQTLRTVHAAGSPLDLSGATERFLTNCKSRNLSPRTLEVNRSVLAALEAALPVQNVADVTAHELRRFFIAKTTDTSPATAARYYDAIRAFFVFLEAEGFLDSNPMSQVVKPKAPRPIIEPLKAEEVEALLASCGTADFIGIRNRLILLMLVDCGLRASELGALELGDVDLDLQALMVRMGKGGKSRRVPFGRAVGMALERYLVRRGKLDSEALLVTCYGHPIDRYHLRHIIIGCAEKAGIEHKRMGPHLLRHTFAVSYLRAGGDVFSLQKMLGHADLTMTRRYSELADSDVQEKHRLYSPADRLRNASPEGKKRLR